MVGPGAKREIWIVPFSEYSCGGYYMAERFPAGIPVVKNGITYNDSMSFWLLSGRMEVLSEHQAKRCLGFCRERGEEITEVWADSLPDGSRWLNVR